MKALLSQLNLESQAVQDDIVRCLGHLTCELAQGLCAIGEGPDPTLTARTRNICTLVEACTELERVPAMVKMLAADSEPHSLVLLLAADDSDSLSKTDRIRIFTNAERLCHAAPIGLGARDYQGNTALDYAKAARNAAMESLLIETQSKAALSALQRAANVARRRPS